LYSGLTFWSPNINIFRDPRWGRGQETFGEDTYLTSRLGIEFIKGMQGNDPLHLKTVATPKHYAVHSGPEAGRHSFDSIVNARDLRETYLPAFKAAITEAGAGSIMTAYNRVNGEAQRLAQEPAHHRARDRSSRGARRTRRVPSHR
jgi:beta-glucosidase